MYERQLEACQRKRLTIKFFPGCLCCHLNILYERWAKLNGICVVQGCKLLQIALQSPQDRWHVHSALFLDISDGCPLNTPRHSHPISQADPSVSPARAPPSSIASTAGVSQVDHNLQNPCICPCKLSLSTPDGWLI